MADGADLGGLRDRIGKLEFQLELRPTKDFVQEAADKVLTKAAANDKDRNETLLKLIDERLGANRSAILTDLARDHQEFREEVRALLKDVVKEEVPDAVRSEVRTIEAEKELEKQKELAKQKAEEDAREKKWLKVKLRAATAGSIVLLVTAIVGLYFAFQGETEPRQIHQLGKVSDALSGIQ
jgi:hypothetical protein